MADVIYQYIRYLQSWTRFNSELDLDPPVYTSRADTLKVVTYMLKRNQCNYY